MYKVINRGNKISADCLTLLESFLECGIPREYKQFLLDYNGGEIEPNCFDFNTGSSSIRYFFQINSKGISDWVKNYKLFKNRIPESFIPIGNDDGGNLILLGIKGEVRNKIYFWDHEFEKDDEKEPDYFNLSLVADSFQGFINMLYAFQFEGD